MQKKIISIINDSIAVKQDILKDGELLQRIEQAASLLSASLQYGGKVLLCGNGGSAADAQHIAAELSGRFYNDRPPLYAEALHVNSSYMTAVANDYGFEYVYARMTEAAGAPGDTLIGISTSGNSPNIIAALRKAREKGMHTIGLTGASGGKMAELCDVLLNMPSQDTPRIQEGHIMIGHILCYMVEQALFPKV